VQSWLLVAAPASVDAGIPGCHPPSDASVLLRVPGGEVFESLGVGYLCSALTGRVVQLEVTEHFNWPHAAFVGRWCALYSTGNEAPWAVTVYDMRTGRVAFEDNDIGKVDAIVLAPDGAVAWVEDDSLEVETPAEPSSRVRWRVREHNRYGTFTRWAAARRSQRAR
jgi:tricorn protease-like protein